VQGASHRDELTPGPAWQRAPSRRTAARRRAEETATHPAASPLAAGKWPRSSRRPRPGCVLIEAGIGLQFELAAIAKRLDGRAGRPRCFRARGTRARWPQDSFRTVAGWPTPWEVETAGFLACFRDAACKRYNGARRPRPPVHEVVQATWILARQLASHPNEPTGALYHCRLMITRNPRKGARTYSTTAATPPGGNHRWQCCCCATRALFFEMAEQGGRRSKRRCHRVDPLTLLASQAIPLPIDCRRAGDCRGTHRRPGSVVNVSPAICGAGGCTMNRDRGSPAARPCASCEGRVREIPAILRRNSGESH